MNTAPDGTPSLLSPDDYSYIRSTEFKERFGDWEKAWRLEKAKRAPNIFTSGQIFLNGKNISGEINLLRQQQIAKQLRNIGKLLGKDVTKKEYLNHDSNQILKISNRNISEILHHDLYNYGSLESIPIIPNIIKNSIFIMGERNQKNIHPNIKTYSYFISGLQIEREIFTVKSVIGISNQNQACYYDHKLISIDKKLLIESAINKKERIFCSGFAGSKPAGLQKISLYNYDKRLYEICQCPQAKFLDKNFEPKKEIIDAVRKGKTLDDLLHTPQRKEPSRSVLDQFLKDKGLDTPSRSVTPPQKNITNPKNNGFEL